MIPTKLYDINLIKKKSMNLVAKTFTGFIQDPCFLISVISFT